MRVTHDIHCIKCGVKVGEVSFEDERPYPGDASYGMLCEACAKQAQSEQEPPQG